jgi:peptidoglycan/LPS O-acetylase OafA/YrhL
MYMHEYRNDDESSMIFIDKTDEIRKGDEIPKVLNPLRAIPEESNEIQGILNKKHYPGLDGLRGISIILVLIDHSVFGSDFQKMTRLGAIGVETFFVISGFLITTLLLKELKNKGSVSLSKFYIRRALRILPVAYLFLFTLLCLDLIFDLRISSLSFLGCVFYFINYLHIKGVWNLDLGHFWTLAIEEQFYVFFPVLLLWNRRITRNLIVLVIFSIPALSYLGFNKIGFFYTNNLVHITTFSFLTLLSIGSMCIFIGCLFSIFLFDGTIKSLPDNKYLSFALFAIAILLFGFGLSPFYIRFFSDGIFSILIGIVVILNLKGNSYLARLLENKILVKIGVLSYSLYIWQQIFMFKGYQPWSHLFKYSDSLFINIPVLLIVSYLSYHFYEKKFLTLKNRFI